MLSFGCVVLSALVSGSALADRPTKIETQSSSSVPRGAWSSGKGAAAQVEAGKPLVVEVFVPLCSESRGGPCGKHKGSGGAADLDNNIYWGAIYGARRYLDRSWLGWKQVEDTGLSGNELRRTVYKRELSGRKWNAGASVTQYVVLYAYHGDHNREALDRFLDVAEKGGRVGFSDSGTARDEAVSAVGFMGRNPLLKNGRVPSHVDLPEATRSASAIPCFSIAAYSRSTLAPYLRKTGAPELLLARGPVASEGYLLEAVLRGLGENDAGWTLRKRAIDVYSKYQKLPTLASRVFFEPTLPKSLVNYQPPKQ